MFWSFLAVWQLEAVSKNSLKFGLDDELLTVGGALP